MTAVLEPASCGGNLPIPAQPWIPIRYGADTIPAIGALDPAATSAPPRAVSGLPGLMKTMLDMLAALLLLVVLFPVLIALALAVRVDGGPAFFRQTRVGPRPALPREVAIYDAEARRRLAVRPGMTGLWQVSGRSDLSWDESVALDLRYVDTWSPLLDAAILARTARAVLQGGGAY